MDLPTYTNIWRIEKRLYKLYDFRLPFPLPLVTVGVWLGVTLVWMLLMSLLRVPLETPWHVVWIVPPWAIAFLATRPVIEGKRLTELLRSQALYITEPRVYTRLAPQHEPDRIVIAVRVWRRDPAAEPLPVADRPTSRAAERGRAAADATEAATASAAVQVAQETAADVREPIPALTPDLGRARTPSIGLRVLNYFGLAMTSANSATTTEEAAPVRTGARTSAAQRRELASVKRRDDAPDRFAPTVSGGSEQGTAEMGKGDTDGRTSREARPHPVSPKSTVKSTTALDGASKEDRIAARRRAEEIMAAPDPVERDTQSSAAAPVKQPEPIANHQVAAVDVPPQPSHAADYSDGVDATAERNHQLARRRLRGRSQAAAVARRLEQVRAEHAEPRETARGHGDGLPATTEEPRAESARKRPRPHAAPWDLPPVARTDTAGIPKQVATEETPWDVTGRDRAPTAEDVTVAHSAPETDHPTPKREPDEPQDKALEPPDADGPWFAEPAADRGALDHGRAPARPDPAGANGRADTEEPAPDSAPERVEAVDAEREPLPELDHGTGAWERVADRLRADAPDHASEPRGDSSRGTSKPHLELDHGTGAWERVADRLRADAPDHASEPRGDSSRGTSKPHLELDHGTGAHDNFSDVSKRRPTEADLAAVEQAALREREAALSGSAEQADAPAENPTDPDPSEHPPQSNRLARSMRSAGAEPEAPTGSGDESSVFTRIAQNARKVGEMLTPARGSATSGRTENETGTEKPDLQLDHGTGEQQLLSDAADIRVVNSPSGTAALTGIPGVAPDAVPEPEHHETGTGFTRSAHTDDSPNGGTRGWRRLARVVTGANTSNAKSQLPPADVERLRTPFDGARRIAVLGCTGGAGQTVTTLMLGHTLAAYRDERVVAVDVNPGPDGLSRRIRTESPETLTSLLANADSIHGYLGLRNYTSQSPSGLEIVATLDDPYVQTLDDRDYASLTGMLERHYKITLLDPAATGVARALPIVDSLVLVAPASSDAARAVALTFEWLDGHGHTDLRAKSVVVVNGVSKRSLADVDAAEQVARGGCRAIVRIPWDDHIAAARAVIDVDALRPTTRRAHAALAGVVAAGFPAAGPATRTRTEANR